MIDIEKLAIECGAVKYEAEVPQVYFMIETDLTKFAKSYLNEWLKEQDVVADIYGHDGTGGYDIAYYSELSIPIKLIALPSEVK